MAVWNFFTHANPLPPTPPSMVKDRTFPLCFGTLPSEDFHGVRNWTSLVDRTHWKNHQACHLGYNMDLYPQLKGVNSQQAEQINRSLRSLSVVLAYSTFDHYMRILELYFVYKNVKTRQGFNKD